MAKFFAMGGYAVFVWPAYAITIAVLLTVIVVSLHGYARARRTVRRLEEEEGGTERDRT